MKNTNSTILVLGASGMLGNTLYRFFSDERNFEVYGSVRSDNVIHLFTENIRSHLIPGVNVENFDSLVDLFSDIRPHIVINCIGVIKQSTESEDPITAISINALLPHRLANLCELMGARLIHISTDCVFSGSKGMYTEADIPDAMDLYGRTKHMGELSRTNTVTVRTSIIGHELSESLSLVDWFLSQKNSAKGFVKAIFSGLPAVEIANVIRDYIIPNHDLHGVYHLSASPINKFDLLKIVGNVYNKDIEIVADTKIVIDRSLDSTRFRVATGYEPRNWVDMVQYMRTFG